ncbi:MAG: DUF3037 domain-containing protein [Thermomicrobiales bacterium]
MNPFEYAVLKVVPRVERGEAINVGVVVIARADRYLAAKVELDDARLSALAPWLSRDERAEIAATLELILASAPAIRKPVRSRGSRSTSDGTGLWRRAVR